MPLLCPGAEFSSDADRQNSVTSKSFSEQSRMSNGYKAGGIGQVFSVEHLNKILWEQFLFRFLLTTVCFYTGFCIYFSEILLCG
jgi:hypothetical protein